MPGGRKKLHEIRVLVADSTRLHTELLASALKCNPALQVFLAAANENIPDTAVHHKINIVVIAARLAENPLAGVEILRKIRSHRAQTRGVILLDSAKPGDVLAAFRAGAMGLFSRDASLETLSECVSKVHAGEIWATPQQMAIALEALTASPTLRAVESSGLSLLSRRELDVVSSLAEGLTNREIAARLGLSQHTIKNYLFRVFDKLGVSSRIELLFLTLNHPAGKTAPDWMESSEANGPTFAACHRAAEQGMPIAQMALAGMYAQGTTIRKNPVSAYMWYSICENNIAEMREMISADKRKMAGLLTTEEILEAQKLASSYQKKPVQPTSIGLSRRASATARG